MVYPYLFLGVDEVPRAIAHAVWSKSPGEARMEWGGWVGVAGLEQPATTFSYQP